MSYNGNGIMTVEDGRTLLKAIDKKKAPAIIGPRTDYRHENVSSFVMNGNSWAFGNARYADRKNLIVGYDRSFGTTTTIESHGNVVIINGEYTSSSNDFSFWVDNTVDISAGSYIFKIEPYVGNSVLGDGKNMHIDFWYDGNETSTYDKRVTLNVKSTTVSSEFSLTGHAYKIRVWVGIRANTYDDYRLFYSLFPSDVTITDTGETISSSGSLTVTPASEMAVVDTMMHTSTSNDVYDTKTYVDEHVPNIDFVCLRPEDFGAVGDGVTDDSSAVQACITAAQTYSAEYGKAIRGYGTYKLSTGAVFNCRELDVYLHKIIYTGNDAAVTISGSFSKFQFDSIRAVAGGNSASCIKCYQSQDSGFTTTFYHNEIKCTYMWSNGNCVEISHANGISNRSMMYNSFYFSSQSSKYANIIEISALTFNENDFYGKLVSAVNGYLVHFSGGAHGNRTVRLYHYCLEDQLKNGTNGNVSFFNCRFAEMMNKQTTSDRQSGRIFAWEDCIPMGAVDTGIDLTAVDVTNALSWNDCLNNIKEKFDSGAANTSPWESGISVDYAEFNRIKRSANANMTPNDAMKNMPLGKMVVYYDNIAYKPYDEIYHVVDSNMTIALTDQNEWEYITPTVFDINTSSATITLDASYCCIAINKFDVIQHSGKTAIVIDKLGNTIFDGTNLGAGVYHFKCEFVPFGYHELYITMENGTNRYCPIGVSRAIYSGSNEKWTVSKEELIEPPVQGS